MYNVFPLKLVALLMWWSGALLKKVNKVNNLEVNIKTCHVIYGVSRNFNPKSHNITKIIKKIVKLKKIYIFKIIINKFFII